MEGLLNIKRTELAELEKKLALEKEQLNLDVAKSIFADENAAFYKKLHAFFTTRVTEVEIASDFIVLYLEDGGESYLSFEEDENYEGEWRLIVWTNGKSYDYKSQTFREFLGLNTHLEICIFLGAFEAFITAHLLECKYSYFTVGQFEQRWRK